MSARPDWPSGVGARAALATTAIVAGTLVAHSWAGGALPSSPYVVGVTALVFGASTAVFRGLVSGPTMFVALGSAQFGLHAVLMLLAGTGSHDPVAHASGAHVVSGGTSVADLFAMDPRMALAHTVSAGLTALMWSLLARALDALVRLPEHRGRGGVPPMPAPRGVVAPVAVPAPWLAGAPRRGPPYAALPRCA